MEIFCSEAIAPSLIFFSYSVFVALARNKGGADWDFHEFLHPRVIRLPRFCPSETCTYVKKGRGGSLHFLKATASRPLRSQEKLFEQVGLNRSF